MQPNALGGNLQRPYALDRTIYAAGWTIGIPLLIAFILAPATTGPLRVLALLLGSLGVAMLLFTIIYPPIYRRRNAHYVAFRADIDRFITDTYNYGLTPTDLYRLSCKATYRQVDAWGNDKRNTYLSRIIHIPLNEDNRIDEAGKNRGVYLAITPAGSAQLIRTAYRHAPVLPHL